VEFRRRFLPLLQKDTPFVSRALFSLKDSASCLGIRPDACLMVVSFACVLIGDLFFWPERCISSTDAVLSDGEKGCSLAPTKRLSVFYNTAAVQVYHGASRTPRYPCRKGFRDLRVTSSDQAVRFPVCNLTLVHRSEK